MLSDLPRQMVICLLLTILIEGLAALALGVRSRQGLAVVTLANIVTNPLLVCSVYITGYFCGNSVRMPLEYALEIAAVITEGIIYLKIPVHKKLNPFLLSLILNAVSYASGYVIALIWR